MQYRMVYWSYFGAVLEKLVILTEYIQYRSNLGKIEALHPLVI